MATIAGLMVDLSANVARLQSDMNRATGTIQSFASSAKKIIGGIGAYIGARQIWNMAEMTSSFNQSKEAFNSMAESMGADADKMFSRIKEMSAGLVDDKTLVEAANRAMSLGIPIEKLGDLMEIARAKSRDMGTTAAQAFQDIATGIGRASPLILDNLGLVLKIGEANETYARSINKTVEEMTEQDKKMAVLNATIDAGKEALARHNLQVVTNKEMMDKFIASAKDMQLLVGQLAIRVVAGVGGVLQMAWGGILTLAAGVTKISQWIGSLMRHIPGLREVGEDLQSWGAESTAALWEKSGKAAAEGIEKLKIAFSSTKDLSSALASGARKSVEENLKSLVDKTKESLEKSLKNYDKYYTDLKKLQGDYKKAIEKSLIEIAEFDKKILEGRKATQDLLYDVWEKANPAGNDMEAYNRKRIRLEQEYTYAMNLSGEDRINALRNYQRAWADMVQQIDYTAIERQFKVGEGWNSGADWVDVEVKKTWLPLGEAAQIAAGRIQEAEAAISQTQQDMRADMVDETNVMISQFGELTSAVKYTEEWIAYLKSSIADLDKGLLNPRTFSIDCTPALNALDAVLIRAQQIQATLAAMGAVGGVPAGVSGYTIIPEQIPLGSYASGTDYVPRTGLYQLHAGEQVIPAGESGITVNMGGITINGNIDPAVTAKKLVSEMEKEMLRRNTLRR